MADNKITGRAKKYDGTPIDYVSIFNWTDGRCIAQVTPDIKGDWFFGSTSNMYFGVTYVANGCEPVTHGPYNYNYQVGIPDDYVLAYSFNGGTLDSSVNNNHGIKSGSVSFSAGRKIGVQALDCKGGIVQTVSPLRLNSDKVTVSLWLSHNNSTIGIPLELSANANINNAFAFYLRNQLSGYVMGGNAAPKVENAANINTPNSTLWTHFIFSIDRSLIADEQIKIYRNGVLESTRHPTLNARLSGAFSSHILNIGSDTSGRYPFIGLMQDLRIYNRVLTAEERTRLFNE